MKVKKLQSKQILKLHLLKYRTYEQPLKNNNINPITDLTLNQIIVSFKKVLQVIFQYHNMNKRILFIGVPKKLELKINKLTNHVAVSKNFNLQGIISNNLNIINKQQNKSRSLNINFKLLLPKLSKKPDLVVIVSHDKKYNILKECSVAKIPSIDFELENNSFKDIWSIYSYKLQLSSNNLSLIHNKNLFFIGLSFLFKTSKVANKLFKPKPLTTSTIKRFKK